MNKLAKIFLILCSAIVLNIVQSCTTTNKALTTSVIVTFGQQPSGGGACAGGGICTALLGTTTPPPPESIIVKFNYDATMKDSLLLVYSLNNLRAKQPAQATIVTGILNTGGNALYPFSGRFNLTPTLFGNLNLPPNSYIDATCPVKLTLSGDEVTMHVKFKY